MATRTLRRPRRKPRAATADILGQPHAPERISSRWRAHFRRLTELRDYLLRRQGGLAKDANDQQPAFSTHMADAGTDTFDRDFALGMLSSEQDALYEIDEALNRIRDRTYGKCELTGKPIESARLEAIPWTRFSAAAEKQLERDGVVKKTRLGPRETVAKTEANSADEEDEE
jgi:RNA polymerase-binding transcription factor DksA